MNNKSAPHDGRRNWAPLEELRALHEQKIRAEKLPDYVAAGFAGFFEKLCADETGILREHDIRPVEPSALRSFDDLAEYVEAGTAALGRCSIAKLNGGLGTSMGLEKAKSLLPVTDGLSFLDIIVRQVEHFRQHSGVALPLLFMNSFNTENDTRAALSGFAGNAGGIPLTFLQNRFPKVLAATGEPAAWPANPQLEWNPPGHGEFYSALTHSGTLRALLDAGIEYLFVSNADNLGATLSLEILGLMAAHDVPFIMEVADRTPNDRKGGHLAVAADGRLTLRESAQCHAADVDSFQDIARHRYFNTNNLWVNVRALEAAQKTSADGILDLPMIRNEKRLDPQDEQSPAVYQIESAMGAAISLFDNAQAVVVPRSRFLPVKKTNDLVLLRSDCYTLNDDFTISENRPDGLGPCVVDLDPRYYGTIAGFDARFAAGAPSLLGCTSLTIKGDVAFGGGVRCAGDVAIQNSSGEQARVADGAHLDGSVHF
ncbi:MAG: UTP--glucose-1-phosphate uridylyltransferase [Gammaproteobacteria bacterium]